MQFNRAIYWFTKDLRLADNVALEQLTKQTKRACFVYVCEQNEFTGNLYQDKRQGRAKQLFTLECLHDISQQLSRLGHQLLVFRGRAELVLPQLINYLNAEAVFVTEPFGFNEREALTRLKNDLPEVAFVQARQFTLFDLTERLGEEQKFKSFTVFRKFIEGSKFTPNELITSPRSLPCSLLEDSNLMFNSDLGERIIADKELLQTDFKPYIQGGESAAQQHLNNYFSSLAPSTYKETRNALDQWSSSTKFSGYLAMGCLSAKQIWHSVEHYESLRGKNESTYWIQFELLWREYFQWLALRLGKDLFQFGGRKKLTPLTCFYPERFAKWVCGTTPYPIVNACMKQLKQTGYMSNRGRQLVASCFVNELGLDWRYGAAYFEQHLIDHDVASNWGNWQYIAGVGVDPRGGRQFNLEKQTQLYDPDRVFIQRWHGEHDSSVIDSTDMVDWPVMQEA